jgi:hypothetical protein
MRGTIYLAGLLALVACDDGPAEPGQTDQAVASDAMATDMAQPDGAVLDAGPDAEPDAALLDAGPDAEPDAALPDAGPDAEPDAALDAELPDAQHPALDALLADAAELDAAVPESDAANPDAAVPDAAMPDAEVVPTLGLSVDRAICNPLGGSVGLEISGTLGPAAVARVQLELRDAAGGVVDFAQGPSVDLDRFAPGTTFDQLDDAWQMRVARTLSAPVDQIAAVVLTVADADGETARAEAPCAAPDVLAEGALCTAVAAFARCDDDLGCDRTEVCRPASAPRLLDAAAAVDPGQGVFAVAVEGQDAEADLLAARVALLDGHGAPLLDRALRIALQVRGDGAGLLGRGGGVLPEAVADPAAIAAAQIWLLDETGLASDMQVVPVRRPQAAVAGGVCDPFEAFDHCPAELACVHIDGDPTARAFCAAPAAACPEAWAALSLAPEGAAPWRLDAEAQGAPRTTAGHCGGAAPNTPVTFVAPASDRYTVRLLDAGPDAVVFGRSHCALTAPRFERGCGTEWSVALRAGDPLTLWVAADGPFSLEISPEAP